MDIAYSEVDEEEYLGEAMQDVPKVNPDEKCRGRKDEGPPGEKVFKGYCKNTAGKGTPHLHEGRCSNHGGSGGAPEDNDNALDNSGGDGAPENNEYALKHGMFSQNIRKHFSDDEEESLEELADLLGEPETTREAAVMIASEAYHKYLRSGDDRFLARFDSLCSTFNIAPDEEMQHLHAHQHDHQFSIGEGLTPQQREDVDAIVGEGKPQQEEVEEVEIIDQEIETVTTADPEAEAEEVEAELVPEESADTEVQVDW